MLNTHINHILKYTFLLLLLFATPLIGFSQSLISKSKWTSGSITIDGKADEWEKPLNFYESKTKLMFALANDSANIYICLRSPEEANQIKISRGGMVVGLSYKNKDKHAVSVGFPLGSGGPMHHSDGGLDAEGRPDFTMFKNEFLMNNIVMKIAGFASKNGIVPIQDSLGAGVKAAIYWDISNIMEYELVIPLKELFGPAYTADDLKRELTLELTVNAIEKSKKKDDNLEHAPPPNMANGSGGVNGSMSGTGQMTGGMASGMPNVSYNYGNDAEKGPLFEKASFKQKFLLAGKP